VITNSAEPSITVSVGTVFVGLATPDAVTTTQLRLPGDRPRIRQYAAVAAVNLLRLHLVGAPAR